MGRLHFICTVKDCERPYECKGFCKFHYGRFRKHGDPVNVPHPRKDVSVEQRFWNKVDKTPGLGPNGACWLWKGAPTKRGYGRIRVNGHNCHTHRYAFFLTYSHWPMPLGRHSCDNPPCVNPEHILEGTHADNTADMMSRNRHHVPLGTSSASSKLSKDCIYQIRKLVAEGNLSLRAIARKFGTCHENIRAIRDRRSWKCLA